MKLNIYKFNDELKRWFMAAPNSFANTEIAESFAKTYEMVDYRILTSLQAKKLNDGDFDEESLWGFKDYWIKKQKGVENA